MELLTLLLFGQKIPPHRHLPLENLCVLIQPFHFSTNSNYNMI